MRDHGLIQAWGGDDPLDYAVERIITQAKTMYRYWPEVSIEDGVLFAERHLG